MKRLILVLLIFVVQHQIISGQNTVNYLSDNQFTKPEEKSNPGYSVARNDPENAPKFSLVGYPFLIQSGSYGSVAICYSADLYYSIIPNFTIFAKADNSYGTGTLDNTQNAVEKLSFHEINAGGIIYLTNKKINSLHHISAWHKQGFKLQNNYLLNVPLDDVVKFGIEGGWYSSKSVVSGKYTNLAGSELNDISKKQYSLNKSGNVATLVSNNIFIGINSTSIWDYLVKFDDPEFEQSDNTDEFQFYLDVLVPINAVYSDIKITDAGEAPLGVYDLNNYTSKNKVGFRTGFFLTVSKNPGITWGLEGGTQPAVPNNAFFLMFKLGIGIHV